MTARFHHRVLVALRSLVRRRAVDDELDAELQFHFQQLQEHEAARLRLIDEKANPPPATDMGASAPDEASLLARRRFGSFDRVKEACRDMRTLRWVDYLAQDLRFGARLLVRDPVFSIVAILSLALGIGANTAIYSLINGVMLRSLPVDEPEQLYVADAGAAREGATLFAYPIFEDTRTLIGGGAEIAAASSIQPMQIAVRSGVSAETTDTGRVQLVSGEYFSLLRQRAQIGRLLTPDDNRTLGQHPVTVISDGYWSRRFGRARDVVGSDLTINGVSFTIVGVTTPGFFGITVGTRYPDLWAPIMMQAHVRYAGRMSATDGDGRQPWPRQRGISWLNIVLRIPSGDVAAVNERLRAAVLRDVAGVSPSQNGPDPGERREAGRITLTPAGRGISELRAAVTAPLLVLLAMVVLVLAITCANVASLLLARATNRHREMAIRLSIGAGRSRLVRQLLAESLMLSLLGGTVGLLVAYWAMTLANGSALSNGIDISQDWRVTGATLALSLITGVAFGLLPALRGTQVHLADTLNAHTRSVVGSGARARPARALIVGQLALSFFLLVVAALFARSFEELTRVDVGFDRGHLIVARVDPRAGGYGAAELPDLSRRVIERIGAIPGVTGVSLSTNPPFSGSRVRSGFEIEGYLRARDEQLVTQEERVTPDYFRVVGLEVVRGRAFGREDAAGSRNVSIISETLARRYFPKQDAIGKRWGASVDFSADAFEIVGVVEDAHYGDLKSGPPNMVYLPAAQGDEPLGGIEIRVAGRPDLLTTAIRRVVTEAEPRLPIAFINTLDEQILGTIAPDRLLTRLTMAFSCVALLLASLGLYGTISYAVTRRRTELGVRMALGADRGSVRWLVMREALWLVMQGVLIGLPLTLIGVHAMSALSYGVSASDGWAYSGAMAILIAIATLAAYVPAHRASRVDPIIALRSD
jgi:predicted permease